MLRATILSFVLMLAAGPNVSLLCAVLCQQGATTPPGCEHDVPDTVRRATTDGHCSDIELHQAALVREDAGRRVPAQHMLNTVLAPWESGVPPRRAMLIRDSRQQSASDARPPLFALRL